MIHEILKILDTTDLQELDKQRITTDLLRLFAVVGRSEQLTVLVEWLKDNYSIDIPDRVVDDYKRYNMNESNNNHKTGNGTSRNGAVALAIELVPKTAWYSNVRSNVTASKWDAIRKKSYSIANNKCEICGDVGKNQRVNHNVECHEIWQYNDKTKEQKLIGLISLCPFCHKTKHVGLAQIKGEEEIVIKQLIKVNKMTRQEAKDYIRMAFEVWRERSRYEWKLDITMLDGYCA